MNRRSFLKALGLGAAALAAPGCAAFAAEGSAPKRPRNIVFILADDLGWGDVGCYGPTPGLTPFLDDYVKGGVRFTDAHSPASTCTPTRYAIFTGQYAWRKPGTGIAPGDSALLIDTDIPTLPKLMRPTGTSPSAPRPTTSASTTPS